MMQYYSEEFKKEAVRAFLNRETTVAEACRKLGVSAVSLYRWVKELEILGRHKNSEFAIVPVERLSFECEGKMPDFRDRPAVSFVFSNNRKLEIMDLPTPGWMSEFVRGLM